MIPSSEFILYYLVPEYFDAPPMFDTKEEYEKYYGESLPFELETNIEDKLYVWIINYRNNCFKVIKNELEYFDPGDITAYKSLVFTINGEYYMIKYMENSYIGKDPITEPVPVCPKEIVKKEIIYIPK